MTHFITKKTISKSVVLTIASITLLLTNRSPKISPSDRIYIDSFLKEFNVETNVRIIHASFENELKFISKIQDIAIMNIEQQEIPHKYFGSINYYFTFRKGFCYDRAIFLEKVLKLYKFNFRHIYVYFPMSNKRETDIINFFRKNTKSHALFEVKTGKGWMLVETNCNWLGVKKNMELITMNSFKKQDIRSKNIDFYKNSTCGVPFWKRFPSFRFIYGVYSRHGDFFSRCQFIPDVNYNMMLFNFLN